MLETLALVASSSLAAGEPSVLPVERARLVWCDVDADGKRDLYRLDPRGADRVFAQRDGGRFEDVTDSIGLGGIERTRDVLWQDFDGDGRADLLVIASDAPAKLLRNDRRGFVDVTAELGLAHDGRAPDLGAQWIDFDGDGRFDLLVEGARGDRLYRNAEHGTFERVVLAPSQGEHAEGDASTGPIASSPSTGASAALTSSSSASASSASSATSTTSTARTSASQLPQCADSVRDQASPGSCIAASSAPQIGMLYPLTNDLFVDAAGQVGLGTLTPAARLDVAGAVRATSYSGNGAALTALDAARVATGTLADARLSPNVVMLLGAQTIAGPKTFTGSTSFTNATVPFAVTSTGKVTNLNADQLDGLDSTAFLRTIPMPLATTGANAGPLASHVNSSAAVGAMGLLGECSSTGSSRDYGVVGRARGTQGIGVYGEAIATTAGNAYGGFFECDAPGGFGLFARATSTTSGYGGWFEVNNPSGAAVVGIAASQSTAATNSSMGVYGANESNGASCFAGLFDGRVHVNGVLSKSGGSFKIDHPLDPANKTLSHSFVESPDMLNVYQGLARTDASGLATIELPAWFDALNARVLYQLTVVGGDFARVRVSREVESNRFEIASDRPFVAVSWQVTGVRKDPWAQKNRIPVEEEKPASMRGRYLNPEAYDQPKELGAFALRDAPKPADVAPKR